MEAFEKLLQVIYSELDLGQEDLVVARRLRARVEDTCKDAKVCIAQNVAKLSLRASWVLALGGGAAVCPRFFRSNGQKGKSLCFQGPAKPWRVWLTPEFAEAKPHLAQLIRAHCAKKVSCQLALRSSECALKGVKGVILTTTRASGRNRKTAGDFLKAIRKIDGRKSKLC